MTTALPFRREAYRLWFEYLRVAQVSADKSIREALKRSTSFYAPWGDVTKMKFDIWWKEKGFLFEDKYVVRRLVPGEPPSNPDSLIIEIPLSRAPTILIKDVKLLVEQTFAAQAAAASRKSKKAPTSIYRLTEGAEPKLRAVREMLTVYRDVYLKHKALRGSNLLDEIHRFYKGRKNKRWAKIPTPLLYAEKYGDNSTALRNMRRYITKAERVMINVANGEFPGKY